MNRSRFIAILGRLGKLPQLGNTAGFTFDRLRAGVGQTLLSLQNGLWNPNGSIRQI